MAKECERKTSSEGYSTGAGGELCPRENTLPFTGADLGPAAAVGLLLAVLGVSLRRLVAA